MKGGGDGPRKVLTLEERLQALRDAGFGEALIEQVARLDRIQRTQEETRPDPGVDYDGLTRQAIRENLAKREAEARAARGPSLWRRLKRWLIRW